MGGTTRLDVTAVPFLVLLGLQTGGVPNWSGHGKNT